MRMLDVMISEYVGHGTDRTRGRRRIASGESSGKGRLIRACCAIAILLLAGLWATTEQARLYAREGAHARLPYLLDAALPELPLRLTREELGALCPKRSGQLAACLEQVPVDLPEHDQILALQKKFREVIEGQLAAVESINAPPDSHADTGGIFSAKAHEAEEPNPNRRDGAEQWADESRRTYPLGRERQLQQSAMQTRNAADQVLVRAQEATGEAELWTVTRDLGLLAAGLSIRRDFGKHPPKPFFASQRGSLADELERLRRAKANATERAIDLTFQSGLKGVLTAGAIAVMIAILLDAGPIVAALATTALAASWLMLADLALTGQTVLRYLGVIQFSPLIADFCGLELPVFPPLLTFGFLLAAVRVSFDPKIRWVWLPAERWVSTGNPLASTSAGMVLLACAAGLVLIAGYSAGISEVLIGIGAVAIGTFVARHAGVACIGVRHGWYTFPVLLLGVAAAVAGSLLRGDLGHAAVALFLFSIFLLLFLPAAAAAALALIGLACIALIAKIPDNTASFLLPAINALERIAPHAAERFHVLADPFAHGTSDFSRLYWLRSASGTDGWGIGQVPWAGLPGTRMSDGLPMQAPSDYTLAVAEAIWGRVGAWSLFASVLAIFLAGATTGLRKALEGGSGFAIRLVAATGAFGCLAVILRALLSAAGTVGAAPITGVPIALLSYAPTATWAGLGYLALVFSLPGKERTP